MTTEVKTTEMRSLPAKYSKYAGFAYWLFGQMKDAQILSGDAYDATCNMMHLFGDLTAQVAFYERFLDEATVSTRLMKAEIKNLKKSTQVKVQKKEKTEKTEKTEKKEKKEKKERIFNTNSDIISQIVLRANSIDSPLPIQNEAIVPVEEVLVSKDKKKRVKKTVVPDAEVSLSKDKKKRVTKGESYSSIIASCQQSILVGNTVEETKVEETKKKRVKKEQPIRISGVEEQLVEELEEKVVVEKKKRVKKDTVLATVPAMVPATDELEEEDIVLNAVSIDGVDYFYDTNNRLYNSHHSVIGTFDPVSLAISIQ